MADEYETLANRGEDAPQAAVLTEPTAAAPTRPNPAPAPVAAWAIPPTMTAVDARREFDRLRSEWAGDPHRHVLGDDRHPEHAQALAYYLELGERADGRDPTAGKVVVAEVFAGGQLRPPGADALSPAPRPVLPEGHQWDEGSLVLAEIEAHKMGARPSLIMEVTDALASVMELAADRGVGWSEADAKAELTRRHGQDGAARVIENARFAYDTLLESEQPLLVRRVRELAEAWGDDPGVITLFGTTLYEALRDGPITPAKEAWFLRAEARRAKADAAREASTAEARRAEEAEALAASDQAFDQTAAQHRRWQSRHV